MRYSFLLVFIYLQTSFTSYSQSNDVLKDFINKNELLVKSVHKHMYHNPALKNEALFRKILKSQLQAVALAEKNSSKACSYAYFVRNECITFMKKNTASSTDYFVITKEEQASLPLVLPASFDFSELNKDLLKKADKVTLKDALELESFVISIR